MSERITGWAEIAAYYGVSESKVRRLKQEMDEEGVIFVVREGKPPQKRICSFPNLLQAFVVRRGKL